MIAKDGTPNPHAIEWLRTSASFDDVFDLLEALEVHRSWEAAHRRNARDRRAGES